MEIQSLFTHSHVLSISDLNYFLLQNSKEDVLKNVGTANRFSLKREIKQSYFMFDRKK